MTRCIAVAVKAGPLRLHSLCILQGWGGGGGGGSGFLGG